MRPGELGFARAALDACLSHLAQESVVPNTVTLLRAWPEPEYGFCVIYRHAWHPELVLGYRAVAPQGDESFEDVEEFGFEVANFQLREPLGTERARLSFDAAGVAWWGSPR
ncbi:MAG TPA: hypothetical protein VHC43_12190 [Mycobacteriales bacterium]|nr:hypothetical protein [Mycobacteriales bacterium]HVW80891.1 hypothetical protein [Mycobacteriales bacterium]